MARVGTDGSRLKVPVGVRFATQEAKNPKWSLGTVANVTCIPLTDPLRHLLNRLARTSGAPTYSLNPDGLAETRRYGWIYEHPGRVALTGAGAYHGGGGHGWDGWVKCRNDQGPAQIPTPWPARVRFRA